MRNGPGIRITKKLYDLYHGIAVSNTPPVRASLKNRIVNILSKSLLALKPEVILPVEVQKLVEEGLLGENPEYNFKFRSTVFSFLVHVTRLGGDDLIRAVGYGIIENIRMWIYADGWPRNTSANISQSSLQLRSQGYITIGLLSRRVPEFTVQNDLQVLRFLLSGVRGETKEMRTSAEEAISSILPCFSLMTQAQRKEVKELAFQSLLDDKDTSGWGSYLKIANRASSFGDPVRIWMCLLACATPAIGTQESSRDLVDDGKKALHPYWFNILHPRTNSTDTTKSSRGLVASSEVDEMDIDEEAQEELSGDKAEFQPLLQYLLSDKNRFPKAFESKVVSMKPIQGVPAIILPEMVAFLRLALLTNCLDYGLARQHEDNDKNPEDALVVDGDWDDKISSELATSDRMRSFVKLYIQDTQVTSKYFELLLAGLLETSNAPIYGNILIEFFPMLSWPILQQMLHVSSRNKWAELSRLAWQGKREERETASYLLGTFMALDIDSDEQLKKEWLDLHVSRIVDWESCATTVS
ncbi:hypothetical protein ABW20_dc0103193 [Dactylellina cionopaga]|nr:hypothetical protein ABW20_dc0103193 [Dactylellina cionopaga]